MLRKQDLLTSHVEMPRTQGSETEQWTPSTIFVVTDHLVQLLVKNLFRRQGTAGRSSLVLVPLRPSSRCPDSVAVRCLRNLWVSRFIVGTYKCL